MEEVFSKLDADADGLLNFAELLLCAQHLGFAGTLPEWEQDFCRLQEQLGFDAAGLPLTCFAEFLADGPPDALQSLQETLFPKPWSAVTGRSTHATACP